MKRSRIFIYLYTCNIRHRVVPLSSRVSELRNTGVHGRDYRRIAQRRSRATEVNTHRKPPTVVGTGRANNINKVALVSCTNGSQYYLRDTLRAFRPTIARVNFVCKTTSESDRTRDHSRHPRTAVPSTGGYTPRRETVKTISSTLSFVRDTESTSYPSVLLVVNNAPGERFENKRFVFT